MGQRHEASVAFIGAGGQSLLAELACTCGLTWKAGFPEKNDMSLFERWSRRIWVTHVAAQARKAQ